MKQKRDKSSYKNPLVVAMNARYGRQQTSHKRPWDEHGGDKNEQQEFLEELDEEEDNIDPEKEKE